MGHGVGLGLVSEDKGRRASISLAEQRKSDCEEVGDHIVYPTGSF